MILVKLENSAMDEPESDYYVNSAGVSVHVPQTLSVKRGKFSKASNLLPVWRKYLAFESFSREKDADIDGFITEWQLKMLAAESAGCQYPDLILAFKLIEKANLKEDVVISLLSALQSNVDHGEVLVEIIAKIESYGHSLRNTNRIWPTSKSSEHYEVIKGSVLPEEPLDDQLENTEIDDDEDEIDPPNSVPNKDELPDIEDHEQTFREKTFRNQEADLFSDQTSRECPKCSGLLFARRDADVAITSHGSVFMCKMCDIKMFARSEPIEVVDGSEYFILPKCPKCFKFLEPKVMSESGNVCTEGRLVCKACDVLIVDAGLFDREEERKRRICDTDNSMAVTDTSSFPHSVKNDAKKRKTARKKKTKPTTGEQDAESPSRTSCQCEICGKSFASSYCVRVHQVVHREKSFKCDLCPKTFRRAREFQMHRNTHTGTTTYVCSYCGKEFIWYTSFVLHVNTHTKAKTYTCTVCDKTFCHKNTFTYHTALHKGDRPYKCDQCDKAFPTAVKLKYHRREVHTDEKPFKCDICERYYKYQRSLESHQLKRHSQQPSRVSKAKTKVLDRTKDTHHESESDKNVMITNCD